MKTVLATLLLLTQLQPLLGTAACLGLADRRSQEECQMPEHGAMPQGSSAQAPSPVPNCALSQACAPSPLAVVILPEKLENISALHSESPTLTVATLSSVSSAPPFHPPRS
jgi:hypothetical protein